VAAFCSVPMETTRDVVVQVLISPIQCSDAGTIVDAAASPVDHAEEIGVVLRPMITYCCSVGNMFVSCRKIPNFADKFKAYLRTNS
jgi:hypothetical protein